MRKNETSYSDAMNEWAARQSVQRNRRNRILHPKPDQPGPLRALGYILRIAILVALIWMLGGMLSAKYYNGSGFNQRLRAEIKSLTGADSLDSADFTWEGSDATCGRLLATGGGASPYRELEAQQLSFSLPLVKRLRKSWAIDHLSIDRLSLALGSGGRPQVALGATRDQPPPHVVAGLLPTPDFSKLTIARISCEDTDLSWGLNDSTRGGVRGAVAHLFSASEDWHLDLEGGLLQQNWLHGLSIDSLSVQKEGDRLIVSDSEIRPGRSEESGTLEGEVTLGEFPALELQLELPTVEVSDLLPEGSDLTQYFNGLLRLSTRITGSIGTPTGVETSSKAMLKRGMFGKLPILAAIDQLLKTNSFGRFSPDEGELEFTTSGGILEVTHFECKSRTASAILRGSFSYLPAEGAGGDEVRGALQLGVRPSILPDHDFARALFGERSEGYAWIEIPLEGPLAQATRAQQAEILSALQGESP